MCTKFHKKTNSSQEKEKHTLKIPQNAPWRGEHALNFFSAVNVKVMQKTFAQNFLRKN